MLLVWMKTCIFETSCWERFTYFFRSMHTTPFIVWSIVVILQKTKYEPADSKQVNPVISFGTIFSLSISLRIPQQPTDFHKTTQRLSCVLWWLYTSLRIGSMCIWPLIRNFGIQLKIISYLFILKIRPITYLNYYSHSPMLQSI